MVQHTLPEQRPSNDNQFKAEVMTMLAAAAAGDTDSVKSLIAEDPTLVDAKGFVRDQLWEGDVNPLDWAVMHQQEEVVSLLLAAGADINTPEPRRRDMTPLHLAAWRRNLDTVRLLVERGANIQSQTKDGLTPLQVAEKVYSGGPTRDELTEYLREIETKNK